MSYGQGYHPNELRLGLPPSELGFGIPSILTLTLTLDFLQRAQFLVSVYGY